MSEITSLLRKGFVLGEIVFHNFINLSEEDSLYVLEMRNHKRTRENLFSDRIINPDQHEAFRVNLRNDTNNAYYLVKKLAERLGVVSLNRIDFLNRNSYLGIYKNPHLESGGIGSILMKALIDFAFASIGLHTLKLEVLSANARAIALYTKFGFQREGVLREFISRENSWRDVLVMGLLNPNER